MQRDESVDDDVNGPQRLQSLAAGQMDLLHQSGPELTVCFKCALRCFRFVLIRRYRELAKAHHVATSSGLTSPQPTLGTSSVLTTWSVPLSIPHTWLTSIICLPARCLILAAYALFPRQVLGCRQKVDTSRTLKTSRAPANNGLLELDLLAPWHFLHINSEFSYSWKCRFQILVK